jgi:arylsulfatase A-like enzyme
MRRRRQLGSFQRWVLTATTALLWTVVVVFGLSFVSVLLSGGSYAGVSDERVEAIAAATYERFLIRVAKALVAVAIEEVALLYPVVLGCTLLLNARQLAGRRSSALRLPGVTLFSALLAAGVYWGFAARLHPGLYLPALSSSVVVQLWVELSIFAAPALTVIALGEMLLVSWRLRSAGVRGLTLVILAAISGGVTYLATRRPPKEPFAIPETPNFRTPPPPPTPAEAEAKKKASKKQKAAKAMNVLWLAVDSLRSDMITEADTPNLAGLVHSSIYFPNTIVPVPRTGPSWAAALTSLDPITTGVETMFPDAKRADLSALALPALLAYSGWRTMVTSEYAGEFFRRVKVGFETESVPRAELMQISGQVLLARAPLLLAHAGLVYGLGPAQRKLLPEPLGELIRSMPNFSTPDTLGEDIRTYLRQPSEEPAFILAFYSQPHFPYTSSPKYARRYRVSGSSAAIAYGRDVANDVPITSDVDRRQLAGLYRAALAESDAAIGRLLRELERMGKLDDTLIVVSADHGEGLYECDTCVGHGDNLRGMMTLRVPIAFRLPTKHYPKSKPAVIEDWVSLLDVYPTLVELLGVRESVVQDGISLIDYKGNPKPQKPGRVHVVETGEWLWNTVAVPKDRIEYPPITALAKLEKDRIVIDPKYEGVIRAAKHRAAIRAPYKLTYEPSRAGVRWRLFDFVADPLDTKDIAAERPEVTAELREALRRSILRHGRVLPVGDYFLTQPPSVPVEHW